MDEILSLIKPYELVINLFPGIMSNYFLKRLFGVDLTLGCNDIEKLFIWYFIGMIVSRFASVVIEPLSKFVKLIQCASYNDYLEAQKQDKQISLLARKSELYRNLLAMGILMVILIIVNIVLLIDFTKILQSSVVAELLIGMLIVVIFAIAYRKQVTYVRKRVEKITQVKCDGGN